MADSDTRQYIKVALDILTHSKVQAHHQPALVIGALNVGWILAANSVTDGHFDPNTAKRLGGFDGDLVGYLVAAGLWHPAGHECDRCPQPKPGWLYAHDYLLHQSSAEDRARLSARGRKAAARRWANRDATSDATSNAGGNARSNASRNARGTASRISDAVTEVVGDPSTQHVDPSVAATSIEVDKGPELGQQPLIDLPDATSNAEDRRGQERTGKKVKNIRSRGRDRDADPHFVAFYAAYPLKRAPESAWRAWQKIPAKVDRESVIAAAKVFAEDPSRDPTYTPHPATWLNAHRWADGPPERSLAIPGRTPNGRPSRDDIAQRTREMGRSIQKEFDHER